MTSAINIGLKYVKADYFFKLDSDDYLSESSLKMISNSITKVKESKKKGNVIAYSFLSSTPDGELINKFSSKKLTGKLLLAWIPPTFAAAKKITSGLFLDIQVLTIL